MSGLSRERSIELERELRRARQELKETSEALESAAHVWAQDAAAVRTEVAGLRLRIEAAEAATVSAVAQAGLAGLGFLRRVRWLFLGR